jgi:NAD(P)-dependent dehydrogenase (short-subunit alcohol dehydrogenase family)
MTIEKGRVALVTGASRGIGRAIAVQLAANGARVVATARDEGELRTLANETGADYVVGSVDTPAGCARIVEEAIERIGPIDILVNNAGIMGGLAPVWDLDPDAWRATLAVNLDAPFELTRRVAGAMVERGYGRIVMVSSTAGQNGFAEFSAYCTSKHGLLGLMRSVAQDVGAHGVTCNAVCPGGVHTPMTDEWLDLVEADGGSREAAYAEAAAMYLPKRLLTPDEIAATVVFLASEEASGINGEAVKIAFGNYR